MLSWANRKAYHFQPFTLIFSVVPRLLIIEEFDDRNDAVGFYTVRNDEQELSETDYFIARYMDPSVPFFESGFEEACELILLWIEEIGKRGLDGITIRKEDDAEALPPKPGSVRELDMEQPPLRLFYARVSNRVLVLCGGGRKTARSNQESGGLMNHFRLANAIALELRDQLLLGDIWTEGSVLESDASEIVIWLKG